MRAGGQFNLADDEYDQRRKASGEHEWRKKGILEFRRTMGISGDVHKGGDHLGEIDLAEDGARKLTYPLILCILGLCFLGLMWSSVIKPPWLFTLSTRTPTEIKRYSLLLSSHTDGIKDGRRSSLVKRRRGAVG